MKKIIVSPKVVISTLGCSKNINDSEIIRGALLANNIEIVSELENANVLIINTCGFIEQSKKENIDVILNAARAKNFGKIRHIIVVGCLAQRYKEILKPQIPEVDYFFGINAQDEILKVLTPKPIIQEFYDKSLITPAHYAYIKISDGCDHACSYCAIPLIKGKYKSRPIEHIINEAKTLTEGGVKELNIIAEDTTFYGRDLYKKDMLPELLERLADETSAKWIRLLYTYPTKFPIDVVKVMSKKSNICNYIDIPLQHASDRILKSMRRNITKDETIQLLDRIRNICPGINIRTTFISGYPQETEAEHQELLAFLDEQKFNKVGFFAYSNEEDTKAFIPKNKMIPTDIVTRRIDELMQVQSKVSYNHLKKYKNKTINVMIESLENDEVLARTEFDAPDIDNCVKIIDSNRKLEAGEMVNVKVKNVSEFELEAELI